jgi:putative membrane protein
MKATSTAKLGGASMLVLASAAMAAAPEQGTTQSRDFVEAAAHSDNFEILAAESALAESRDARVRSFAQQMIDAHSQTTRELADATTRAGMKFPPKGLNGDQASFLSALQSQKGPDFDKVYVKQQVLAHSAALAVEQQYAADGDQPDLKKAAASAVSTISAHLAMAEEMQTALGGD